MYHPPRVLYGLVILPQVTTPETFWLRTENLPHGKLHPNSLSSSLEMFTPFPPPSPFPCERTEDSSSQIPRLVCVYVVNVMLDVR